MNQNNTYRVYLAELKREDKNPSHIYKVGVSGFSDVMERLAYKCFDEPNPIIRAFPLINVLNVVECEGSTQAYTFEKFIMSNISGTDRFHNWYEPRQLSGITEMRLWNDAEVSKVIKMMKLFEDGRRKLLHTVS